MRSELWVVSGELWVVSGEWWVVSRESWVVDTEYWIKNKVCWTQNKEHLINNNEYRITNDEQWIVVSGKLCHAAPKSRDHFSIFINFITLLDTIFYRKSLEVTALKWLTTYISYLKFQNWQFKFFSVYVSSSEFCFWKKWNLYRELFLAINFKLLLDTIFYRKSLEVTASWLQVRRYKENRPTKLSHKNWSKSLVKF